MHCRFLASVILVASEVMTAQAAGPYARVPDEAIDLGRRIFEHNWSDPGSWSGREPLGSGGDGLGPMFNAVSCAACHVQGGTGGGGGNERNVELLSVVLKSRMARHQHNRVLNQARLIHPLFSLENRSLVLHRFGYSNGSDLLDYASWRNRLTTRNDPDGIALSIDRPYKMVGSVRLELAHRNTPPLWGLGLIEQIRIDEGRRLRKDLARLQQRSGSAVTGRIPRTPDGDHGWYGWRGHVGDLREFVLNACAVELGLQVPGRSQPKNPIAGAEPQSGIHRLDLTREQVTALTAFVAHLPRPVRIEPDDPDEWQAAVDGERLFHLIGCAECHVDAVSSIEGVYSDLLLHDMGRQTSDQSTSIPDPAPTRRVSRRTGGYSGGSIALTIPSQAVPTNIDQEWRTPPLWGVADSAPYFHDGRALTLDEAIRHHAGEAAASANEYRNFSEENRQQLLTFLGTLRAPQPSSELESEAQ